MSIINWREIEKLTGWARMASDEDAEHWDIGAAGWQRRIGFEQKFSQAQADALTKITSEDTVLDACCGTGRLTLPLAKKAKHVYSVDAGKQMLEYCSENVRSAGFENVTVKNIGNWHKCEPGREIPVVDVAVACISPAQADIIKFSRCARKYCYFLSFTGEPYRFFMAELFQGVHDQWGRMMQQRKPEGRQKSGIDVPFNVLYQYGANPTVDYVDGGWEYEADTAEEVYRYLAGFSHDDVPEDKWEIFRSNCDKRMEKTPEGRYRYFAKTQMYVLGWDPSEIDFTEL